MEETWTRVRESVDAAATERFCDLRDALGLSPATRFDVVGMHARAQAAAAAPPPPFCDPRRAAAARRARVRAAFGDGEFRARVGAAWAGAGHETVSLCVRRLRAHLARRGFVLRGWATDGPVGSATALVVARVGVAAPTTAAEPATEEEEARSDVACV